MIKVHMRNEPDGRPGRIYIYNEAKASYTQDQWLYVIDEDGKILGAHPEVNVDGVHIEGGRTDMLGVDPNGSDEAG